MVVHRINSRFHEKKTEGIILVDALNAFNSTNRKVVNIICPPTATLVYKCYSVPSKLIVVGVVNWLVFEKSLLEKSSDLVGLKYLTAGATLAGVNCLILEIQNDRLKSKQNAKLYIKN